MRESSKPCSLESLKVNDCGWAFHAFEQIKFRLMSIRKKMLYFDYVGQCRVSRVFGMASFLSLFIVRVV